MQKKTTLSNQSHQAGHSAHANSLYDSILLVYCVSNHLNILVTTMLVYTNEIRVAKLGNVSLANNQ